MDWDSLPPGALGVEKAYADDRSPYGGRHQLEDFLRALGGADPYVGPDRIEFEAPAWKTRYRRQPWIRRVNRKASVKLRGAYPDMPRPTPESRRVSAERRRRLRIDHADPLD